MQPLYYSEDVANFKTNGFSVITFVNLELIADAEMTNMQCCLKLSFEWNKIVRIISVLNTVNER